MTGTAQMRQAAIKLRNAPEAAAETPAKNSPRAAGEKPQAEIALDLKSLIAPYRKHRRLTLRIEKMPQLARLSAGQNNGDNSWSLALHDLDGLSYFPPDGFNKDHVLVVRVIAQGDSDASTIALLDFPVLPEGKGAESTPKAADGAAREEAAALKLQLAAREAELAEARAAGEAANARWQQKLEDSLAASERARNSDEAVRFAAAKAALQAQYERDLGEIKQASRGEANRISQNDAARLIEAQQELAEVKSALATRDSEQSQLRAQLAGLAQTMETEIAAARKAALREAAETLKTAEAAWQKRSADALAEITARCQTAEAALAAARASAPRAETELTALRDQMEKLRQASAAEIAAAKDAAGTAEKNRLAESARQAVMAQAMNQSLTELTARAEAAEAALAGAQATAQQPSAEAARLQERLEQLARESAAAIAAVKDSAARDAADKLKSAEAAWQSRSAAALAELGARAQAAEAALAAASATPAPRPQEDDGYVLGLQREIESLRKTLVDREADLAKAHASVEELRRGVEPEAPGRDWHPLPSKLRSGEAEEPPASGHLVRDVMIVFAVVIGLFLLWPRIQALLPDNLFGDLFGQQSQQVAVQPPPPPAPPPQMKATVARLVNMRAEPKVGAAVLASLSRGAEVTILGNSGNWDHVAVTSPDGKVLQGWVYASYLSSQDQSPAQAPPAQSP